MANTYTQITIQLVFAVQNRKALIRKPFQETLHKYIGGIFRNQKQKLLVINSVPDHIHILFGMSPTCRLSDLVRDVKSESSRFINEERLSNFHFNWQEGYGAFSYSKSQRDTVIKYILNQEEHHRKKNFREEYFKMLDEFEIEYKDEYCFEFFD